MKIIIYFIEIGEEHVESCGCEYAIQSDGCVSDHARANGTEEAGEQKGKFEPIHQTVHHSK